jgi:uncharacterized membrane protein (DUF373 family)
VRRDSTNSSIAGSIQNLHSIYEEFTGLERVPVRLEARDSDMMQTTMEQTISNSWPRRFRITLMAYDITRVWEVGTRFILSLLILTILLGLAGGVVKTFLDLRLLLSADVEVALRQVLVDTLTLLAVVEVLKTTLAYCSEGRVRVTFIIDTVLVVMLTEVISRWFTGGEWHQFAILGGILLTLGLIRIVAVRYSPALMTPAQQANQPRFSFP